MGRKPPTGSLAKQHMAGNTVTMTKARASPKVLRRRIAIGDPASSGYIERSALTDSVSMPDIELSPIQAPFSPGFSSGGGGSPGGGVGGSPGKRRGRPCSVMLQHSNGDIRRVRLPARTFGALVAHSVKDGELPRFYSVVDAGERRRLQSDADLTVAVRDAKGCAPIIYVKSEPYPEYARSTASLMPPSSWDSAVYPGSPLNRLADVDSTVDRVRRPKPANPYYDGIVGSLQENTSARPFLNDPDPDHPAFTTSRLRRAPILCAKQKRGPDTPLPYSLPSFGPAGGMDPREAGHGEAALSRLIYTKGTWTMSVPTSRPAIDNRQRHPDVPDELSECLVRPHEHSPICSLMPGTVLRGFLLWLQTRARLQMLEENLRGLGAETIEDLKEFTVPQLREIGFTKLQVEKIGKEIARTLANADKRKRSAAEVRF